VNISSVNSRVKSTALNLLDITGKHRLGPLWRISVVILRPQHMRHTMRTDKLHTKRKIRILIVEDEDLIRWSLGRFLELAGYTVDIVSNGREALELLEERSYHVIVTDLNMPEIGGSEMLQKMRDMEMLPPVIIISSIFSENVLQEEPFSNAFRCINKPFKMEEVLSVVKEAVDYTC
jgi:CheY-like chemotaxis protein